MREERGQTTVEWLVIMVGLIALAGVLAGQGMWQGVAKSLTGAFSDICSTRSRARLSHHGRKAQAYQ